MIETLVSDFPVHTPRPAGAPNALEGVRVLDFGHYVAAPFASMILADMGADVIKVESPGRGDEFRHYGPVPQETPAQGAPFMWSNRNKRSVAVNLKSPAGVALVKELIANADVLSENFSTGVMERFGLDYASIKELNPRIIYCSVSAYGRNGAFKDRLGFDPIAQAESGFISMNGYADEPIRAQSAVIDIGTGMMLSNAILGALLARERTGEGQQIEVALIDTAVLMTGWAPMQHLYSGAEFQRRGNSGPDNYPSDVFKCQDKAFFVHCGNDNIFQRLAKQVLDRPDLADHPVYSERKGRLAARDELGRVLEEAFAQRPWAYWQPRMRVAKIPCGEVRTLAEALRSPEARERDLISRIPHPVLEWVPNIRNPAAHRVLRHPAGGSPSRSDNWTTHERGPCRSFGLRPRAYREAHVRRRGGCGDRAEMNRTRCAGGRDRIVLPARDETARAERQVIGTSSPRRQAPRWLLPPA